MWCKSRYSWEEWIASLQKRKTPSGKDCHVVVSDAQRLQFVTGNQVFGSGCYKGLWSWCSKDGTPPKIQRFPALDEETPFIRKVGWEAEFPCSNYLICKTEVDAFGRSLTQPVAYREVVIVTDDPVLRSRLAEFRGVR